MSRLPCLALFLATLLLSAAGLADCPSLQATGEQRGDVAPVESRLTYDAFQRDTRVALERERQTPSADAVRILKERFSLDHQETLVQRVSSILGRVKEMHGLEGERRGESFVNDVRDAIADSDKGKLKSYQDSAWSPTNEAERIRSDGLLNLITLRETKSDVMRSAQRVLEQVLVSDFDGRAGEGILSRRLSNQDIRDVVNQNFFLKGALHDLPGIYDAFVEFTSTRDEARFRNRLRYNFSHNGPGRNANFTEGFWGGLFNILVPNQLKQNGRETFFDGTIYSRDGRIRYPEGASLGWFIHTATDRMSGE